MRSNHELVKGRVKLLSLLIASSLASGHAAAQQPTKPNEKKEEVKLENIVVTATKRLEPLQSIPVAVSVVSGEELEKSNLNNITSITQQLPTVNYRANASNKDTALFIRGIGTISTSPGVEPTVATVVDGVVLARPGMATLDLMEVERLEVLRGPQGTLFGKNASAGVINIVSKAIPKEKEGYIDLGYYDKKETRLRFGIAGPLVAGTTSGSLALFTGKYDGNVNNVFLNRLVNGYDRSGVRGKLEFTPNKDVTVTFIADYAKADDTGTRGPFVRTTTPVLTDAVLPQRAATDNREISTDVLERVNDKNSGLSAQVDFNTAKGTLTSITAFRSWENTQYQDIDGISRAISQQANLSDKGLLDSKQSSQELRWASAKGGFIDYVVGFLYFKNETDEEYRRDVQRCATTLPALPSGLIPCGSLLNDFGVANYGTELKSTSFFGESVWNFDKGLRGIFGLRHTKDDLSYYHGRFSTQAGAIPGVQPTRAPVSGSTSQSAVSGRIGPQMDLSKEVSVYATYSKGYKGPAYNAFFNMQPVADIALNPETSKGWELGLKSTLADSRVRLNLAVFNTKYQGYQANFPDLVAGVVVTRFINAGDVSTKGFELDFQGKVSKDLTLSAAYANTKAVVDQFNCPAGATCTIPSGTMLPSAPRRKGVVRANYKTDIAGHLVDFGTDYTWQSETQYDLSTSPNTLQPAYGIWNAAVSIVNIGAGLRVTLIGKNLADKSYSQFLLPGANTQRSVPRDERRYFGINVRYDF